MKNIIKLTKSNNEFEIIESYPGIKINFSGENNVVSIMDGAKFSSCTIFAGHESRISIGKANHGVNGLGIWANSFCDISIDKTLHSINNLKIWASSNSTIGIGENFSCWGVEIRCQESDSSVQIGKECMFSEEILIYPTDVHSIYEIDTKTLTNRTRPIVIGDHVWCGRRSSILKGVSIENDSIIGMGSVLSKSFYEKNVVITGSPAEIVKRGVNWTRDSPANYSNK